ncbi:MAG TPA: NAD(P)/FAD-dependent oxidoreductase, partial [Bdellovibrionales bacterium]|nr:NAD(P)/FAD-dependent oxidoreductase [Bdellovibrionales bacterium]
LFQPLLYQVAMAGLSPADIATPIRSLFAHRRNVRVLMAEVEKVDIGTRRVFTSAGEFAYDELVLSCGAEHSYFGHDEWEDFAPGLKTLEQATEIRRRVLLAFEKAEAATDPEIRREWLTFLVVGGGPTGVELAGALGEITRYTLASDFRNIDPSVARVILIEAGPRLLASFDESLGKRAQRDLEELGVQIWLSCRVNEVNAHGARIGGEVIRAKTAIWAAGVKPSRLNKFLDGAALDKQGRVIVGGDLTLPGHPEVHVIGDQAHAPNLARKSPSGEAPPLPGLAPVAIQQGRFVAKQIVKNRRDKFVYVDKGEMATIGRRRAVAEISGFRFGGFFAWMLWLLIHIYFLIGFKNRFFVLWQWAYSYLTFKRGARLITARDWHSQKE